jgi:carbon starvation protein CstA
MPGRSEEPVDEKQELKRLRRLDRVYACYAYLGLFTIAALAVSIVPVSTPDGREGYGMALVLPGTLVPIVLVTTIVLTVRLRSHKPLRLLGRSTLFLALLLALLGFAASVSKGYADWLFEYAFDISIGIYGCAATIVPVWWFAIGRRRFRESLVSNPQ